MTARATDRRALRSAGLRLRRPRGSFAARLTCIAALLAVLAVMGARDAVAARLPDWAKAVATNAPSVPEGIPRETARVLFAETRVLVKPDGHLEIRRRLANQALSATAEDVGLGEQFWDSDVKIVSTRAWHLPPGERAEKSSKDDAYDVTLDDAFTTDSKIRRVRMRGIKRGSIAFFEFEAVEVPRMMSWVVPFWMGEPVLRSRYELEVPEGWTVRTAWLRHPGPEPETSGLVRAWTLENLPGVPADPLSSPPSNEAPMLVVSVAPPPGSAMNIPVVPDWPAFAAWYEGIVKGRDAVDPEISEAAKKALAGSGPGALDRVLAASTFVRDRVRYVAKEVGIGSLQPRPAKDTLANLYGDCKDKGTLLRAILAADGRPSFPVLVNLGGPDRVSEEVPAFWFDHFIVAVPLPPEVEVPPRLAHAVLTGGDLGRLLILDTTDEYLSLGWISAPLAGQKALVLAGPRSRLVELPDGDAAAHRLDRRLRISVGPDRALAAERETRYYGQYAARARAEFRQSSVERRKAVERAVERTWIGAEPTGFSVEDEASDGAFVETIAFRVPPPAGGTGGEIALFPGASDLLPRAPLQKRTAPVVYGWPMSFHMETSIKGGSRGPLPPPQSARGEGWSSTLSSTGDGNEVRAVWDFQMSTVRFPSEEFASLRKLWGALGSAEQVVHDLSGGGASSSPE